ncbi:LytTR family DNA-binding domain-containing protein [Fulvivirga sp. M361]|uniref:LytR/AlgR family response regulator transcription factor n=1 Tax=Fulvivirga sp. M361 TaxID=2594266 RepID=UPI001628CA0A|nr:LytTR family DNA-binding domain-containing protein [Fulvivirga sp. M361]
MNCIIIEDQLPAQRILKKYITDLGTLNLTGTYTDALQAVEVLKTDKVGLIFLDIHLPKLSGIDFLKTLTNPPQVILTTAFPDYALESYDLDVVDYLLKPFSFQRFIKAVSKITLDDHQKVVASDTFTRKEPDQVIFVKSGYEHIKINIDDIVFLKSDSDYTELYLEHKKHLSSEPLKFWEQKLRSYNFIRIHKSYIINSSKIHKVAGNHVHLSENILIPVGRAYKDGFSNRFLR